MKPVFSDFMIGIISDTHDNTESIKRAVDVFKDNNVDVVIHCGDLICPLNLELFEGLNLFIVKGNCDGEIPFLKKNLEKINGQYFDDLGEITLNDKNVAFTHGHDETIMSKLIESRRFDYVFHGHTHEKKDEKVKKTRVINPGALYMPVKEKTVALLDLEKDKLEFIEVK